MSYLFTHTKRFVKEAIEIFIEECQEMGTLEGVLDEAGFSRINDSWELRKRCRSFEKKYNLSSDEFYKLFQEGKIGDKEYFFEWKALIEGVKEWVYTKENLNGGYIADIPDLKYCSAFGNTQAEALQGVLAAKEAWFEAARSGGKPRGEGNINKCHS